MQTVARHCLQSSKDIVSLGMNHAYLGEVVHSRRQAEQRRTEDGLPMYSEIEALLKNGSTQRFIAQRYATTEANLSIWMKKHGLKRAKR